jgi:multiple antibiotic resistance protein
MPIMFGPGVLATIIGMSSLARDSFFSLTPLAIALAIIATMLTTYIILTYAKFLNKYLGPQGIDAATRIVGFFVSAIGMGLIFHGIVEALQNYKIIGMG